MKKITLISICNNTVASTLNSFYTIESGRMDNDIRYTVLVDSKTGFEYLYTSSAYTSTMTPRYNADGSLCVYNGGAENDT